MQFILFLLDLLALWLKKQPQNIAAQIARLEIFRFFREFSFCFVVAFHKI